MWESCLPLTGVPESITGKLETVKNDENLDNKRKRELDEDEDEDERTEDLSRLHLG